MRNLLVLQLKRIGDVLLSGPAIERMHLAWPEAKITLVTCDASGAVAGWIPGVDLALNCHRGGFDIAFLRRLWASGPFDAVIDFNGSDRSAIMTWMGRAPVRATYEKHRKRFPGNRLYTHGCAASLKKFHTVGHLAALPEVVGPMPPCPPMRLELPEAVRAEAARLGLPQRYAVIHAGTARREKYWVGERWAEVADYMGREHGLPVVLTGGADRVERQHLAAIRERAQGAVLDYTGRLSLAVSAAAIGGASVVATVDTAALHAAAAFQVPQVALFGPANPFRWKPLNDRAVVLQAGVEQPRWATEAFEPQNRFAPMEDITAESVMAGLGMVLERSGEGSNVKTGISCGER